MRAWVFLLLLAGALLLPGLGRLTLERQQELRVVLCARTMAQGGSWLIPEFQGNPRLRKPPGMYWLVAPGLKLYDSPFMARLPGACAGAGLLLAVYAVGAQLLGRRRALLAAVVCATSFGFLRHARLAEIDISLLLCTTLAVACLFRACFFQNRTRLWLGAGLCMGLGFLLKGPAAVAIPLFTLLVACGLLRGRCRRIRAWQPLLTLGLFAALAAPWYGYLLVHYGGAATIRQELSDTFVASPHANPVYYYLYTLPKMMLPWAFVLPFAFWFTWKRNSHRLGVRLAAIWFTVTFLQLSAISSKQDHYALLLLPPACLLVAPWLYAQRRRIRRPLRPGVLLAAAVLLASLYAGFLYPRLEAKSRIPGFISAHRLLIDRAELIHVVGVNSAIFEYYCGRGVHPTESVAYAYRRAAPGHVVVVIQKEGKLDPADLPAAEPLDDVSHRGLRHLLYQKETRE